MKKEGEARRKAKAATKRAEAKNLAEQEEAEIEKSLKRVDKKSLGAGTSLLSPKVTAAELAKGREEEELRSEAGRQAAKKRDSRTADEEDYERLVLVENTNRDDKLVDARNIDAAVAQMGFFSKTSPDRHPERRLKASYKAFEDAMLPSLKAEKPGLTLAQYKDLLGKLWKKSPDNPLN